MGSNKKIEELKSRIDQINNETIASEPQQRLGYYFKGENILTVMNETLDQNGEWKIAPCFVCEKSMYLYPRIELVY